MGNKLNCTNNVTRQHSSYSGQQSQDCLGLSKERLTSRNEIARPHPLLSHSFLAPTHSAETSSEGSAIYETIDSENLSTSVILTRESEYCM